MRKTYVFIILCLIAFPGSESSAQSTEIDVMDMSPSFQPGMYTTLSVDANDSRRVALGTFDGFVMWSEDGGLTSRESRAISPRRYDPMTIRSGAMSALNTPNANIKLPGLRTINPERTSERSLRVFLANLGNGTPPARHSFWMSITDPLTEITDIAWPKGRGKIAAAGPAGIILSDRGRGSWLRTLGKPGPMPGERSMQGISVAINPQNANHVIAATDQGIFVSQDGGNNFIAHTDPRTIDDYVIKFRFDSDNPDLLFAITPGVILMSEDAGKNFEPAFSTEAEILNLSLSPEAALISTTDGLQIAGAESVVTVLKGKRIIGAVPWKNSSIIAVSDETIYKVSRDQSVRALMQTGSHNPFISVEGNSEIAWVLSSTSLLRLGTGKENTPRKKYRAPKLSLSLIQVEKQVVEYQKIPPAGERYLHPRWYAQILPQVDLTVRGGLSQRTRLIYDGVFPIRYFYADAYAQSNIGWEIMAKWDLSNLLFGDTSNIVNPEMIIESSMRDGLDQVLREVRSKYREAASLARRLKIPPSDPELEFMWRMRLEELGAYLEAMAGKNIVTHNSLEPVS